MNKGSFFVMLNHPVCQPLIMTVDSGDGDDIAYFETKKDADISAQDNDLGDAFGYEVFQLGCGE